MNVVSNGLLSVSEFLDDYEWITESLQHPTVPIVVGLFVRSDVHVREAAELAGTEVVTAQELTYTVIPRGSVLLRITHVAEVTR